ncbi:uncharacterized protein FN964_008721 isoform 2-T2 [Alca torda]
MLEYSEEKPSSIYCKHERYLLNAPQLLTTSQILHENWNYAYSQHDLCNSSAGRSTALIGLTRRDETTLQRPPKRTNSITGAGVSTCCVAQQEGV